MALAVIVAGVVVPLLLTVVSPSILLPVVDAVGMAILAAGLVLLVARERGDMRRHVESLAVEVRCLSEHVERCYRGVDAVNDEVGTLGKTVDGERRNLGMVAEGLGEMRQIIRMERQNLGLVAGTVEETKGALLEIVTKQDELQRDMQVERRNLGLVAGALDDLRRTTAGVHLFDARQAAFEDTLIQIADRVDRIGVDHCSHPEDGRTVDAIQRTITSGHVA